MATPKGRDRGGWTRAKTAYLDRVQEVLESLREYWPLTLRQVSAFNLPRNPDALKLTDSRARKYMREFGDLAVELDALPPATLEQMVISSIENRLDLELFNREREQEEVELGKLDGLRGRVVALVAADNSITEQQDEEE